jgi:uncharacterized protein
MTMDACEQIAAELHLEPWQTRAVAQLLAAEATIPFIARYRKEATGSLDEVAVAVVRDRLWQLAELNARRAVILKSLAQHGHLTPELEHDVRAAASLTELEDIYLPFRPKRRTRAAIAREKGLEPLALAIFAQNGIDPSAAAVDFVDPAKQVPSVAEALSGARDIIAEMINENANLRARLRRLFQENAVITSTLIDGKQDQGAKFRDYFSWQEPAFNAPSHRILAMRRGEKEQVLSLSIAPPEQQALGILQELLICGDGADSAQVGLALVDSYRRLLSRSLETEARLAVKEAADAEAIRVFSENLRHLLMDPPLGPKTVLAIDPGFRTGCKAVCLDRQGKLLHHETLFFHLSEKKDSEARERVAALCREFGIEAIAVGNGTAGRETAALLARLDLGKAIAVVMTDESGASIYSASEIARGEFPDLDLTVRGAVSIGRRLMDPLAELVKIDPRSIGVGQYQHDVDEGALQKALDDVVVSCVNAVGVDVNRASVQLLTYVSGIGPALAQNIVTHRDGHGPFLSRQDLKSVARLGPKAFEQSAGFLRIIDGDNPLDASAVHPESYGIVEAMARDMDCTVKDLIRDGALRANIDLDRYVSAAVGRPTLEDIVQELARPGRDPRQPFNPVVFAEGIATIGDLKKGMKLPGIVSNVTAFGAFVDIGVHQDGLVHVSQLADRFVKDPAQVVKVHQSVQVTVLDVDLERGRIALSMRSDPLRETAGIDRPKGAQPKVRGGRRAPKTEARPFNNPFHDALAKGGV